MPSLSVIVLNYRTPDLVIQCLASVLATVDAGLRVEILVVDNASGDGSLERIGEACPEATLIAASSNLGFAGGNNLGLRRASGDLVLLLNSDTIVCEGTIARLVDLLARNPSVGAVGSRILNSDLTDQDYPTRFPTVTEMLERRIVRRQLPWPTNREAPPFPAERIMGACLMTRRDVLQEVGLFDDNFFMYDEDMDWCLRCRNAGWQLWLVPDVSTIHLKGQTSRLGMRDTRSFNGPMFVELRRSRYRLYRKHAGASRAVALKLCTDAYLAASLAAHVIRSVYDASARRGLREKARAYAAVLRLNPFALDVQGGSR